MPPFRHLRRLLLEHVHYNKQLEIKEHFLSENLRRIGGIDVKNTDLLPVRPSPDIYLYRNKLEVFRYKDGKIALGMRKGYLLSNVSRPG